MSPNEANTLSTSTEQLGKKENLHSKTTELTPLSNSFLHVENQTFPGISEFYPRVTKHSKHHFSCTVVLL